MLSDYSHVVGVILEGGAHWTFVAINMRRKRITYIDPMGNERLKHERLLKNWEAFAHEWNSAMTQLGVAGRITDRGYIPRTVVHPTQAVGDAVTCGIYSCMVRILPILTV